jgi:energy-coupling factor transport system permease protein
MSDFLSQSSFGMSQYYDQASVFHRLDPRTRLIGVLVWLGVLTGTASVWGLVCGCAVVLLLLRLSRTPMRVVLRQMARPLLAIMLLVLLQIVFSPADNAFPSMFQWGLVRVSAAGIMRGVKLLMRFSALYLLLNWMTVVLSSTEIIRALAQLLRPLERLGIPTYDVVLLVQVALHFLPLFYTEIDRIAKAQASRGAVWGTAKGRLLHRVRQTIPVLLPLFITSLHKAENLAQAIEARGYGAGPRTSMVELRYSRWDAFAYAVICLVAILILFLTLVLPF